MDWIKAIVGLLTTVLHLFKSPAERAVARQVSGRRERDGRAEERQERARVREGVKP